MLWIIIYYMMDILTCHVQCKAKFLTYCSLLLKYQVVSFCLTLLGNNQNFCETFYHVLFIYLVITFHFLKICYFSKRIFISPHQSNTGRCLIWARRIFHHVGCPWKSNHTWSSFEKRIPVEQCKTLNFTWLSCFFSSNFLPNIF